MARQPGEETRLAGAFETTEKTAPGSGYAFLPTRTNEIGLKQGLLDDDTLGDREPGDVETDNPVVDGPVGIPVDVIATGWWLKALLGAPVTTSAADVYTHVFTGGAWSLPSFSLEKQSPRVPSFEMFSGCRANKFSVDFQRGGYINATVDLIAQYGATPAATAQTGTPAVLAGDPIERFVQKQVVVKLNDTAVGNVVSASFTYTNNLDPVGTITADGFIGGLDPMRSALTGSMRVRFDSEALFNDAKSVTAKALSFEITRSADKKLTLTAPRVFLSVPERPVTGPGGVEAEFTFTAARSGSNSMFSATLINGQDAY